MRANTVFQTAVDMQNAGDDEGAKAAYKRILAKTPNHAEALGNLARLHCKSGDFALSDRLFERARAIAPQNPGILLGYAVSCLEQKRHSEIEKMLKGVPAKLPDYFQPIFDFGIMLLKQGGGDLAEPWLRKALEIAPGHIKAKFALANAIGLNPARADEAMALAQEILAVEPENDFTLSFVGQLHLAAGRLMQCLDCLQRAYAATGHSYYLNGLATAYNGIGESGAALKCIIAAANDQPENLRVRSSLLFTLNYDAKLSAEEIFAEYRRFDDLISSTIPGTYSHETRPSIAGRRIRIGFVSGDFRNHACAYFVDPLFRHLDRNRFELFAYSTKKEVDDATTRMRGQFDHWADVGQLDEPLLAKQIVDDAIDVLVDLAGHTDGNRLSVFAMKAAPIQISYLGFGYTTGLAAMDYFIGDETLLPEGAEALFSEKLVRLPRPMFCYDPMMTTPDIGPSPAERNGFVTFGSLTRLIRMNDEVLTTWRDLLLAVPDSRLLIDSNPFSDAETRDFFQKRIEKLGLPVERVTLRCSKPHWPAYNDIDITLDCWPHNIGTTAIESLWMGVPVLSRRHRPSVGRVASVFNHAVGLDDWSVETNEAFIARGVAVARDIAGLAALRKGLRNRVLASPLADHAGFTRAFEDAVQGMVEAFNDKRR